MKRFFIGSVIMVTLIMLIPLIVVMIMGGVIDNSARDSDLIKVYFDKEDTVKEINIGDYLVGVVAAEIPAEFEAETLKAQAVAARTYMKYHQNNKTEHKDGAVVCTDYKHCQAWVDINEKMEGWGDNAKKYRSKMESAVSDTSGELVKFESEPINAVFFSTSSGKTENAVDVWGEEVPYLISVNSPGEEGAPHFMSEKVMSVEEVKQIISANVEGADFSNGLFGNIIRSDAGGIITIEVGGVQIKGTALRTMLDLRSTNVQIKEENGNVIFNVKGNGHGVGMSQYGANAMAKNGCDYKEILTHYYSGCVVSK